MEKLVDSLKEDTVNMKNLRTLNYVAFAILMISTALGISIVLGNIVPVMDYFLISFQDMLFC